MPAADQEAVPTIQTMTDAQRVEWNRLHDQLLDDLGGAIRQRQLKERPMTSGPRPMCLHCRHFNQATPTSDLDVPRCTAFPDGIPHPIFYDGRIDHRRPWPGDRGVRFDQDPNLEPFNFTTFVEIRDSNPA